MSRIVHCCLDVRGALSWDRRRLATIFKGLDADQARERLLDCVRAGYEVIPIGPECDGFDYIDGCPGHDKAGGGEVGL